MSNAHNNITRMYIFFFTFLFFNTCALCDKLILFFSESEVCVKQYTDMKMQSIVLYMDIYHLKSLFQLLNVIAILWSEYVPD